MSQEREEDFLSVDTPIPGQNYVCLSFVSPEKMIKSKEKFFMVSFLNSLLQNQEVFSKYDKFNYKIVNELYEGFLLNNKDEMNKAYDEMVDYKTSMRTVKIRGTYDTLREAKYRAKCLQKKDKNFDVFVGQVGYWLPWDPSSLEVKDQEYTNNELNTLMKKYKENKEHRDEVFEKQKEERIRAARENSNVKVVEDEQKDNLDKIRNIANVKDGIVENESLNSIMGGEFSDPWMERKQTSVEASVQETIPETTEESTSETTPETTPTNSTSTNDNTSNESVSQTAEVKDDTELSM